MNYRNEILSGEDQERENLRAITEVNHVHEITGSVASATSAGIRNHSHRFATMTSRPIKTRNGNLVHAVRFWTDSYDGHLHEFRGMTTEADETGSHHIHYLTGLTSINDGHRHEFKAATLIDNPTGTK